MKAVILAGGLGTRISEETYLKPKPMVDIGGKPILWHIMKIYAAHGIREFIVCCGYKGYVIKEYFANYFLHMSDVTFDLNRNTMKVHHQYAEPWCVTLIDTGEHTLTGGRLKRVSCYLEDEEAFCFTYGDGVADLDISAEAAFHRQHGKLATVMAVQPPGRYGALNLEGNAVKGFMEKPKGDGGWINAGFFILSPKCIAFIDGDDSSWEGPALERIAAAGELMAFQHRGVLAAHGYPSGQEPPRTSVAERTGALEGVVMRLFGDAYDGCRVLLTGHTGFKGSWMTLWLDRLGADITGIALEPETTPNHWDLLRLEIADCRLDIRDAGALKNTIARAQPDIVFHFAAQPLVRRSYRDPLTTWSTNVMGTANLLDACRLTPSVRAVVVITTDKCYENREWGLGIQGERPVGRS